MSSSWLTMNMYWMCVYDVGNAEKFIVLWYCWMYEWKEMKSVRLGSGQVSTFNWTKYKWTSNTIELSQSDMNFSHINISSKWKKLKKIQTNFPQTIFSVKIINREKRSEKTKLFLSELLTDFKFEARGVTKFINKNQKWMSFFTFWRKCCIYLTA
jgi:hypothetical protein